MVAHGEYVNLAQIDPWLARGFKPRTFLLCISKVYFCSSASKTTNNGEAQRVEYAQILPMRRDVPQV